MSTSDLTVTVATTPSAGAVGLVQVSGQDVQAILHRLTGEPDWPVSHVRVVDFADIDHGLAVRLRNDLAQLMPHGGPWVIRKLLNRLLELGATVEADSNPLAVYPEANTPIEADMLAYLARAASPAAIDLLLAQPLRWQTWLDKPSQLSAQQILDTSTILDQLIDPPCVVVIGQPNVGKSTLTNQILGRSASLVANLPGTTRDWVGGLARLGSVAVRWLDTPGLRDSDDPIEQQAIALAGQVIVDAKIIIAMREPTGDWPDLHRLAHEHGRSPDLWVTNKVDDTGPAVAPDCDGSTPDNPLPISALHNLGLDMFQQAILKHLGLDDLGSEIPWAFSPRLRQSLQHDRSDTLHGYV